MKKNLRIFLFLISCFFVVISTIIVFLPKAIEWKIKNYLQEKSGLEISYLSSNWSKEGLVLNDVKLKTAVEDSIDFQADIESLSFKYSLDIFDRYLAMDLKCQKPKFFLKQKQSDNPPISFFKTLFEKNTIDKLEPSFFIAFEKTKKIHLIDSSINLHIDNGFIEIVGLEENKSVLPFSFKWIFGSKKDLAESFDFNTGSKDHQLLFSKGDKYSLTMLNYDVANLFNAAELFIGKPYAVWSLKKGLVSANVKLDRGSLNGFASLTDLSLEHRLSGIGAFVPDVTIQCQPKASFEEESLFEEIIKNTFIEANLNKKASLYRFKQGLPFWLLKDIDGTISINKILKKGLLVDLNGLFFFSDKEDSKFTLKGSFPLNSFDDQGDLLFSLASKEQDNVVANLIVNDKAEKGRDFDLSLQNIGPREYETVRNILPEWSFVWEEAQFLGGSISLHLKGNLLPSSSLSKLSVEKLSGKDVWFKSSALSTEGYISSIFGNMDFIISQNEAYLQPRNGQLTLNDGDFYWESKSLYDGQENLGRLNHLDCKLKLKDGILQNGSFKGNLGGLESELEFLGLGSETVAKMKVQGLATKVVDILPGLFANKLKKSLGKEEIAWQGAIKKRENGLFLEGSLHLSNLDVNEEALVVELGAFLERLPKKEWEDASVKWKKWGVSLLEKDKEPLLPFQRKGSSHILRVNWLKDSGGSWGVILRQGTFSVKNLTLKRWLEPFIAPDLHFNLSGLTTLWGDFNDRSLIVNFDLSNFIFDNTDFKVTIDQIRNFDKDKDTLSDPSSFVYFDFQDDSMYGFMPIQKASYLEKATQLQFDDISALLSVSQNHLLLSQIETKSEGIRFKGDLDADFSSKEALNIVIKASEVDSSIEQMQKFCAHFNDLEAWRWPLKGQLSAIKDGVIFEAFVPLDERKSIINWSAQGSLNDGSFVLTSNNIGFNDLNLNFEYSSKDKVLNLQDVESLVNVIDDEQSPNYNFSSPYITYSLSEDFFCDFDTSINTKDEEFIKLKGNIHNYDDKLQLALDPKVSHIGGFYPKISECVLDKEGGFKILKAKPYFLLNQLTQDLKRLNQLNLFPSFMKTQINNLDPKTEFSGELKGKVNLDLKGFNIDLEGKDVKKNNKLINKCFFKAYSKDHLWLIEDCRFGTFSMQGEMEKKGDEFFINHLGIQDAGISLQGNGLYKNKQLSLNLTEGQIILQDLKISQKFHLLSDLWHPKGTIDINGNLSVNFNPKDDDSIVAWKGWASLNDLEIKGNRFKNQNAIPITFSEIDGLKVQDISLSVKQAGDVHYKTNLNLKGAHWDFEEDSLKIEGLGFSLSTSALQELVKLAKDFFPSLVDEETSLMLKDIKRKGGIEGLIDIDFINDEFSVGITLSDGLYTIFGNEHLLNNVYLGYSKDLIVASANYKLNSLPVLIKLKISKNEPDKGEFIISEGKDKSSLKVVWKIQNQNLEISNIEGSIAGIYAKLGIKKTIENKGQVLSGFISLIDSNKLKLALPASYNEILQDFKIGSGYTYKGDIFLSNEKLSDLSLLGKVEGKDFNLLGFELDALSFDLSLTPNQTIISKLVLDDNALKMQIKEIVFQKNNQDKWFFNAPLTRIENLRPIRLAKDKKAMKSIKNLIIYEILVENLNGFLGDSSSIKGKASLTFEKVVKNTFGNILLSIPSDILGRIGLNLNVMTPSMGTIYFDIKDKRIYLLKLDEVYSEGKHSRFYLPKETSPSYIDFDGNLNVYLKIKHYNLFMKLTESLRMHITGKLDNPTINFEKDNSSFD